jgi:hypothetical protein
LDVVVLHVMSAALHKGHATNAGSGLNSRRQTLGLPPMSAFSAFC